MGKTVTFYTTADGKCPMRDFLDSLPAKTAQKATWVLKLLEDLDIVPSSYFKKLSGTEEIWECRITFGSNAYRIFCFFAGGSIVVLTHGFLKKSQKTPTAEMGKAEVYRKDFLKRRIQHERS
jgi:phage-related protein